MEKIKEMEKIRDRDTKTRREKKRLKTRRFQFER